jgi:hypothetical protein
MKNIRFYALLLTISLFSGCAGTHQKGIEIPETQLIESNDLADLTATALELAGRHGHDELLVIFDLDNTLLAMEQDLGSNQWYDWQSDLQAEDPCNPRVVTNRLAVQGALYSASAMRLTQDDAPNQVRTLQQSGLDVFILTSRGPAYRFQTLRELRRNGFSFYNSGIGPLGGYAQEFVPAGGSRHARYEDGVFMTAGQNKGDMLKALLDKTHTKTPSVVLMADDSLKNLENMIEAFAGSQTSILAYRYGREDKIVADFDGEKADQMWQQAKPAFQKLESLFGADNYQLPVDKPVEGCNAQSE